MTLTKAECDTLYRKHAPGAFRRAQRMLGSVSDADELVHDVFLALFERAQSMAAEEISAYLYGAVTHACLNRIRNRRNRERLVRDHRLASGAMVDPGTRPEWSIAARELVERLPEPLAEVAIYYYLDELSQREIARILGRSHRHVGQLLVRLSQWAQQQEKAVWPR